MQSKNWFGNRSKGRSTKGCPDVHYSRHYSDEYSQNAHYDYWEPTGNCNGHFIGMVTVDFSQFISNSNELDVIFSYLIIHDYCLYSSRAWQNCPVFCRSWPNVRACFHSHTVLVRPPQETDAMPIVWIQSYELFTQSETIKKQEPNNQLILGGWVD